MTDAYRSSTGIYTESTFTVSVGALTAIGGDVSGEYGASIGIYTSGHFIVSGGEVTADASVTGGISRHRADNGYNSNTCTDYWYNSAVLQRPPKCPRSL